MNPKTKALAKKIGKFAVEAPFGGGISLARSAIRGATKVGLNTRSLLQENARLNQEAEKIMNKRYPSGWATNATHAEEVSQIKRQLRNKK